MTDAYQPLPQYQPPTGVRMATAEEQKPLMKMLGKMLAPKLAKGLKMRGKISSQNVKVKHQKKVTYW